MAGPALALIARLIAGGSSVASALSTAANIAQAVGGIGSAVGGLVQRAGSYGSEKSEDTQISRGVKEAIESGRRLKEAVEGEKDNDNPRLLKIETDEDPKAEKEDNKKNVLSDETAKESIDNIVSATLDGSVSSDEANDLLERALRSKGVRYAQNSNSNNLNAQHRDLKRFAKDASKRVYQAERKSQLLLPEDYNKGSVEKSNSTSLQKQDIKKGLEQGVKGITPLATTGSSVGAVDIVNKPGGGQTAVVDIEPQKKKEEPKKNGEEKKENRVFDVVKRTTPGLLRGIGKGAISMLGAGGVGSSAYGITGQQLAENIFGDDKQFNDWLQQVKGSGNVELQNYIKEKEEELKKELDAIEGNTELSARDKEQAKYQAKTTTRGMIEQYTYALGIRGHDIYTSDKRVKNINGVDAARLLRRDVLSDEDYKVLEGVDPMEMARGLVLLGAPFRGHEIEFLSNLMGDDNKYKYDIKDAGIWRDDVLKGYMKHIRNYFYNYKPEARDVDPSIDPDEEHIGPMAQDIEQVNPACVIETDDGVKTVDTGRLALMNAGAIAELARVVSEMKGAM
jgi:hypothetical protein